MSLTIHVLGPLVIESNGCRLDKLPKKARALLAFLAAQNGEAVSRERLADLLWPYQGSEQGRHSLRNCLLELRKALGREAASDLAADFTNCRIEDATGRHEFRPEELAPIQTRITRRISRELHVLLLQAASRRAFFDAGMEHGVSESLSRAASALQQGYCAELSAEAQRWYLTALASDPRNVEALTGLAVTCQHLVSNPWWAEPRVVATASDLGREAAAIALAIAPGHSAAHCVQGMLYSAAGQLDEAGGAFERALATDSGHGTAHGFAGYNAAFLGRADETVPANERAMSLDRSDRRHSIWLFFGGFAELLLGRSETSISLLRKSLERNPTYGSARLFLAAALSTIGRDREATEAAAKFRELYPQHRTRAFEQLWLSRSGSAAYRAQIHPAFEKIRGLGLVN